MKWFSLLFSLSFSFSFSRMISPFSHGLAAASVASVWCSLERNASFVRSRVAQGEGDTKENSNRNRNVTTDGMKSSVMSGINSPAPSSPSTLLPWFGVNNRDVSQRLLLMIEKRAKSVVRVKASSRSRSVPKTHPEEDQSLVRFFEHFVLWDLVKSKFIIKTIVGGARLRLFFIGEGCSIDRAYATLSQWRLYNTACSERGVYTQYVYRYLFVEQLFRVVQVHPHFDCEDLITVIKMLISMAIQ